MHRHVLKCILHERQVNVFALIVDEATDISHKEQICITFRCVDSDFNINEVLLELINVPKTDASTLTKFVLFTFLYYCVNVEAKPTMGLLVCKVIIISGVATQIKKEKNPAI